MNSSPPPVSPSVLARSRGNPGGALRSRGFSQALIPFVAMVFGAGLVLGALLPRSLQPQEGAVLLLLIAAGLHITWRRAVNILLRHEEGARGEEMVARVLDALPGDWRFFHGVPGPGKNIDHVLLGENRLYTVETVHWNGQVRLVNGKLMHGENFYPGYELVALARKAADFASQLQLRPESVVPMLCVVGGRFGDHPGLHQGVWLGEIQDLGPFLLTPRERSPDLENRGAILRKLEELTSSGDAA